MNAAGNEVARRESDGQGTRLAFLRSYAELVSGESAEQHRRTPYIAPLRRGVGILAWDSPVLPYAPNFLELRNAEVQLLRFSPVDAHPAINEVKAGRAIPVKFSLGGDQGLDIFRSGYPKSMPMACDSTDSVDAIEQTLSDKSSHLTYDTTTDTYTYVWKTDRSWVDTCRQLVVKLNDGSTEHVANFTFVK